VLTGGVSTGKKVQDVCGVVQNQPQNQFTFGIGYPPGASNAPRGDDTFCHQVEPWSGNTQLKLAGSYPLPIWGVQASANFQYLPGLPLSANWVLPAAQVTPALGRPLNTATVSIPIMQAFTEYGDRIKQLDFRFVKTFRFGGSTRLQGIFDLYNAFNSSTVLGVRTTYPTGFLAPTAILGGRLAKFSAQYDF
jgi:hypothetical protein